MLAAAAKVIMGFVPLLETRTTGAYCVPDHNPNLSEIVQFLIQALSKTAPAKVALVFKPRTLGIELLASERAAVADGRMFNPLNLV